MSRFGLRDRNAIWLAEHKFMEKGKHPKEYTKNTHYSQTDTEPQNCTFWKRYYSKHGDSKANLRSIKLNKKSELMLMRCVRAYSSFCSHVDLVDVHPFRCNSFFCSQNHQKVTKNPYFWAQSLKVIDVDTTKMCVTSTCYDKPHVCACLQTFSH